MRHGHLGELSRRGHCQPSDLTAPRRHDTFTATLTIYSELTIPHLSAPLMTAPCRAPLYIPGKATVQRIDPPVSPTYAGSLLSPSLSLSELSVCISLLPSHLSDLTVGGSPPEPPPVSADFLLQVHASRRSGDEAIGRNKINHYLTDLLKIYNTKCPIFNCLIYFVLLI